MSSAQMSEPVVSPRIVDLMTHPEVHVTVPQLAEYWKVHTRTIYRHIEKGALRVIFVGPYRAIRVPIQEARRYGRPVP